MLLSRVTATLLALASAAASTAQQAPDAALRALQDGNRRFAADQSVIAPLGEGARRSLARGQSPTAIVLCCADSTVPPEHIFNAGLGELFVVRVAGHVCDAETLASIEYAVEQLGVPLCVVMGHENCGAIAATVQQVTSQPPHRSGIIESRALQQLLERIEPSVRRGLARDFAGAQLCAMSEEEHAHDTVHECLRRSELLRRYAAAGRFRMVAARYHQRSGEVEWLPPRPMPAVADAPLEIAPGAIPAGLPPHVALQLLQAGHRRFLGVGKPSGDVTGTRREALTHGQRPLAIVLTCADSRVAPEHVFDAGLGELFVVRIAGNTLTDNALASIEYAAWQTGASLLVVMGHTQCSAVQAAAADLAHSDLSPHMRALLARIEPSIVKARTLASREDAVVAAAVAANTLRTLAEARSRSPLLRQLEAAGRFSLLPVVYDLSTGDLQWLKDTAAEASSEDPAAAPLAETRPAPAPTVHEPAPAAVPNTLPPAVNRPAQSTADAAPSSDSNSADSPPGRVGIDSRLLVGLAGVASLSLAALLLLRRKG